MTGQGIHIHRWRNEYIVPREHPEPESARLKLDQIARHLPDELCTGLEPWMSSQPEPVVLLNRIVLDCELDLSRDSWLLVSRWAQGFARTLMRAVELDGEGMLRFPSRAAFHAQFISDIAAGRAWRLWYYRPFHGLQALPASNAIRTLLVEEPALGRATLTALTPQAWLRVASTITRSDTLRILEGLSDDGGVDPPDLAAFLNRYDSGMPAAAPWFTQALRFFAEALRAGARPTRALAYMARLAGKLSLPAAPGNAERVAAAVAAGDVKALIAADSERDAEAWSAVATHPEWRPLLAEAARRAARSPGFTDAVGRGHAYSSFAGLAMLVPEIDVLLSGDVSRALPHTPMAERAALAAWVVLGHCAGSSLANSFSSDSFWRDFFAIPPTVGFYSVMEWLKDEDADPALSRLAERAAGLARGQPLLTPFRADGARRRVLADMPTRIWLRFDDFPRVGNAPWRTRIAAARLAQGDWKYLSGAWCPPPKWRLFFAQVAQIALRRFAYRMPGFAAASLPYVFTNFLVASGQCDLATGELRLSRPPLHTLLQFTGTARGVILWSGPPARRLRLEFES